MKWGTQFVALLVVITLASTPFFVHADYEGKKLSAETMILTPMGTETRQIEILEKDLKYIEKKSSDVQNALTVISNLNSETDEKKVALEKIEEFVDNLKDMGLIPFTFPVTRILTSFLSPKIDLVLPVISLGKGISWIPIYPGEAFIGFMFRPIIMQYFFLGYTASLNINLLPPRIEYWDMVGTHTVFVLGFVGVYIDFGKIGYGIPNLQFVMGEGLLTGGFDWL